LCRAEHGICCHRNGVTQKKREKCVTKNFHYFHCILLVTCHGACLWFSPIPTKSLLRIINSLINAFFWVVMQRVVVISYRLCRTTHRSDLQCLSRKYRYSLCNDPEERSSHLIRDGSLEPRISSLCFGGRGVGGRPVTSPLLAKANKAQAIYRRVTDVSIGLELFDGESAGCKASTCTG